MEKNQFLLGQIKTLEVLADLPQHILNELENQEAIKEDEAIENLAKNFKE